jgi:hypothetical protein
MANGDSASLAAGMVRCPTCKASQDWSDECRRCKSDLRLLRAFADAYELNRRACLEAICSGDAAAATHHAQRCHLLEPNSDSRRMLALAALLREDWAEAAELGGRNA